MITFIASKVEGPDSSKCTPDKVSETPIEFRFAKRGDKIRIATIRTDTSCLALIPIIFFHIWESHTSFNLYASGL